MPRPQARRFRLRKSERILMIICLTTTVIHAKMYIYHFCHTRHCSECLKYMNSFVLKEFSPQPYEICIFLFPFYRWRNRHFSTTSRKFDAKEYQILSSTANCLAHSGQNLKIRSIHAKENRVMGSKSRILELGLTRFEARIINSPGSPRL